MNLSDFPVLNASLNGGSAILLVAAWLCIRGRRIRAHATLMICAVVTSTAFLVCYIIYHALAGEKSSGLPPSALKTGYLIMLATHVLLAIGMVPMILTTLWRAYRRQWDRHRRIAIPTFWIWLYVSVTGVIIYWMLYHLFPSLAATGGKS